MEKECLENSKYRSNNEIRSMASDEEIADLFLYCSDGVFLRFINSEKQSSFDLDLQKAFNTIYLAIRA